MNINEYMSNYAFNEMKNLLNDIDCEEIVADMMIEKFGMNPEDANKIVAEQAEKWYEAYAD